MKVNFTNDCCIVISKLSCFQHFFTSRPVIRQHAEVVKSLLLSKVFKTLMKNNIPTFRYRSTGLFFIFYPGFNITCIIAMAIISTALLCISACGGSYSISGGIKWGVNFVREYHFKATKLTSTSAMILKNCSDFIGSLQVWQNSLTYCQQKAHNSFERLDPSNSQTTNK